MIFKKDTFIKKLSLKKKSTHMNAENELEHANSIMIGSEQLRWKWFRADIREAMMGEGRRS